MENVELDSDRMEKVQDGLASDRVGYNKESEESVSSRGLLMPIPMHLERRASVLGESKEAPTSAPSGVSRSRLGTSIITILSIIVSPRTGVQKRLPVVEVRYLLVIFMNLLILMYQANVMVTATAAVVIVVTADAADAVDVANDRGDGTTGFND